MITFDTDFTLTIDGQAVAGAATLDILNPATEQVVAKAPDASQAQLDQAVDAARRAFPAWRDTPLDQRRAGVAAIAEVIGANLETLAPLFVQEQGRPLNKAVEELMAARCGPNRSQPRKSPSSSTRTHLSGDPRRTAYPSAWSGPLCRGTSPCCWACGRSPRPS